MLDSSTSGTRLRGPRGASFLCCFLFFASGLAGAGEPPVRSLLEMRQHNVVVQQWDLSCGAAALATVLAYQFGERVTEREVALKLVQRKEYIADPSLVAARQGFSLLDLKRAAESYGYQGLGLGDLTLKDLVQRAPLIVPVSMRGYNHFVVFRGVLGDKVVLADPAWGNRTLPVETFEQAWMRYPEMGKLGFAVIPTEGGNQPNRLAPRPEDFVSGMQYRWTGSEWRSNVRMTIRQRRITTTRREAPEIPSAGSTPAKLTSAPAPSQSAGETTSARRDGDRARGRGRPTQNRSNGRRSR